MTGKKVSKYPYPSLPDGGIKMRTVRGLFEEENYRVSELFTDADRKWRAQWFKDQILSPNEPRHVPELELLTRNPIRRGLSAPWKFLEAKMTPVFGSLFARWFRLLVPKTIVSIFIVYAGYYHFKYNQNDWTSAQGWDVTYSKPIVYPGEKDFPAKRERFYPHDYDDRGFKDRKVFREWEK